ncbi:MAG: hypothetical protein ACO3PR_16250, partial [Limisphaerales bacterium]
MNLESRYSREPYKDILSQCWGSNGVTCMLDIVNGFADLTMVFRCKRDFQSISERIRSMKIALNHQTPGKQLQKHPRQLDGKQCGDEEQNWS